MESIKQNLYIPANIKTRLEFFKGYGIKELVITICVMTFFTPLIILINILNGTVTAVIVSFIILAGTVIGNAKDDNNICIFEQMKFMIRKLKRQKKYKYRYYDGRK